MRPWRWALLGCGDLTDRRLAPTILSSGDTIGRVWGRSRERREELAHRHGAEGAAETWEQAIEECDASWIATSVDQHVEPLLYAIRLGRPVVVEKPVTAGLGASRTRNLGNPPRVAVAWYRRFYPVVERLGRLAPGSRPWRVSVRFSSPFDPAEGDPRAWRLDAARSGGGVVADAGCHRIELLCHWLGRPGTVEARYEDCRPAGIERKAWVRLGWPDGSTANLELDWHGPPRDRLRIESRSGAMEVDLATASGITHLPDGPQPWIEPLSPSVPPHTALIADLKTAVESGCMPRCTLAEGLEVDGLLVAARRADANGAPVRLEEGANEGWADFL